MLPLVLRSLFCLFLSGRFTQVLLYLLQMYLLIMDTFVNVSGQ